MSKYVTEWVKPKWDDICKKESVVVRVNWGGINGISHKVGKVIAHSRKKREFQVELDDGTGTITCNSLASVELMKKREIYCGPRVPRRNTW